MTVGTMLASLAVAALACLTAWRLVDPLAYAVFCVCGGRRTASGTAGRWLALSGGVMALVGLMAATWIVLMNDPTTWSAPQPYHLVLMMVSLGLSLGYYSAKRHPGTVIWWWRQEHAIIMERRARRRAQRRGL